jgi:hypothetical protein
MSLKYEYPSERRNATMQPITINSGRSRLTARLLILAPLLLQFPLSHADSYLNELEAEASSTGAQNDEKSLIDWSRKTSGKDKKFPRGLSQEEFTQTLKDDHSSLHIYYDKFSGWDKKKVYEIYQETRSVGQVRREIKARMPK